MMIKNEFLPPLRDISYDINFVVQFLYCGTKKLIGQELEPESI